MLITGGTVAQDLKCYHANREAIVGSAERITKNFLRHASGVIRAVDALTITSYCFLRMDLM